MSQPSFTARRMTSSVLESILFPQTKKLAGIMEMAARGIIAYMVGIYGFSAACFSSPLAWIFADIFLIPAYFICKKRLVKKYSGTETDDIKKNTGSAAQKKVHST